MGTYSVGSLNVCNIIGGQGLMYNDYKEDLAHGADWSKTRMMWMMTWESKLTAHLKSLSKNGLLSKTSLQNWKQAWRVYLEENVYRMQITSSVQIMRRPEERRRLGTLLGPNHSPAFIELVSKIDALRTRIERS